jgi:hypothetical protein
MSQFPTQSRIQDQEIIKLESQQGTFNCQDKVKRRKESQLMNPFKILHGSE